MTDTYHYHWKRGERNRRIVEFACMDNSDLIYTWNQPDCDHCQSFDSLPIWCSECGTLRDIKEPLFLEIQQRGLDRFIK